MGVWPEKKQTVKSPQSKAGRVTKAGGVTKGAESPRQAVSPKQVVSPRQAVSPKRVMSDPEFPWEHVRNLRLVLSGMESQGAT